MTSVANLDIMGESGTELPLCPDPIKRLGEESPVPNTNLPLDGLCLCGCGNPAPIAKVTNRRQGCIAGHPQRYIMGHQSRLKVPYAVDSITGCWNFNGYIDESGYGRAGYARSKSKQAHIVYYEKHVGKVPEGMQLDHTCKNKRCVNPKHLEPVTHAENVRRSAPRLTAETAREAKQMLAAGASLAQVMNKFGISKTHAHRLKKGQTW